MGRLQLRPVAELTPAVRRMVDGFGRLPAALDLENPAQPEA